MTPSRVSCFSALVIGCEFSEGKDRGGGGGYLEPWSPEIFVVEAGARSLSLIGARTEVLILAKWNPGMERWSPRAPNFPSWSPGALHFLGRSPGALNPFGTLIVACVICGCCDCSDVISA